MKIYLAATAPGNESQRERGMLDIPRRLLSFYMILEKQMGVDQVFEIIKQEIITNENLHSRSGTT